MAIRVTLDRVLLERRMSLTELSDRVGVTLANLSILKTGKAKAIRFSTLEAICRELECQPGDLLVEVRIVLPRVLDERSKELMHEFGRIQTEDVRAGLHR